MLKYAQGTRELNLKYGISFIDEAQARENMEREVAGKTVAELQSAAVISGMKHLGKSKLREEPPMKRLLFILHFYRCYERPVGISEDGRYYSRL